MCRLPVRAECVTDLLPRRPRRARRSDLDAGEAFGLLGNPHRNDGSIQMTGVGDREVAHKLRDHPTGL
jgi:hypothetical protein